MSTPIHAPKAPQFPLPFSHGIRAGDFVYVSGQVGVDPVTREVVGDTVEEQTIQCLRNIETILAADGLTLEHVIKVTSFVTNLSDFPAYNKAYEQVFSAPYPTRSSVQVGIGSYLIEIEAIAYVKSKRGEA
ncbi:RidA family protein [Paenibacillus koleovorans]|uniref:RidA family protein n=1 Tax=Paenibacillus koleovorans TaxID=121608 RepID=UPI000FD78E8D|nr:RidA family protein [Paenibacillus koleovorans]